MLSVCGKEDRASFQFLKILNKCYVQFNRECLSRIITISNSKSPPFNSVSNPKVAWPGLVRFPDGELGLNKTPEMKFVNAVTAGGSVIFFASGVNFSRHSAIYNINDSTKYILFL